VSVSATDTYADGHGSLQIKALSFIPIDESRGPETDQGELLRYLSETIWFPTALLADYIRWESIDAGSARATISLPPITASGVLHIDKLGRCTHFTAQRYRLEHKQPILTPWIGRWDDYREINGFRIPMKAEAIYTLDAGEFSYFRGEVTEIGYDEAETYCRWKRPPTAKRKGTDAMTHLQTVRGATGWALGSSAALATYLRLIRPWQLRWGATDDEVARPLPGDDDVPRPTFNATRAVTITARPEEIWPWLIQIGVTRAGWYSYDWLDNLGRPSAERIMPEFQHLAVGDVIALSPDGKEGQWVRAFEPNCWMLWGDKPGNTTWYWGLEPLDEEQTRLITRVRMRYTWTSPMVVMFNLLVEFTDIVMMRKCLLGIKRRAEAAAKLLLVTKATPETTL
jgi:hypothetical protein